MQETLTTNRLLIEPLTTNDTPFIFELVNTDGWIQFIGNRNITSSIDACTYIEKIISNSSTIYWVVKLKTYSKSIGIITLIKRDYLKHYDIGFAFLPNFCNNGYAYEAASKVLEHIVYTITSPVFATTIPENINSIKLLKKLGLNFIKEIEINKEKLHVYSIPQASAQ